MPLGTDNIYFTMGAVPIRRILLCLATLLSIAAADVPQTLNVVPTPEDPTPIQLDYRYDHLLPGDGLPHFSAYDFVQDSQGYLWIGTEGGVARYDGYTFKHFKYKANDPSSLSSSKVYEIMESTYLDTTYLWLRTSAGLNRLNLQTEKIVHFVHDPGDTNSIQALAYSLATGDSHSIWIGTRQGLDRYDYRTGVFQHYLRGIAMEAIHRDAQGYVWIGSDGQGLLRFLPATGELVQYTHDPQDPSSISGDDLVAKIFDSDHFGDNYLWVGTDLFDLNLLNKRTGRFQRFRGLPVNPLGNAEPQFESIRFGAPELWLMTYPQGLKVLDLTTGRFSYQRSRLDDPDGLFSDTVLEIFEDRSGVIWIASFAGVNRFNRFERVFKNLSHLGSGPNRLVSDCISALCLDSQGRLWLGGKAGISILDPSTGRVQRFSDQAVCPALLGKDLITDIEEDAQGHIWFMGMSGLYRLDSDRQEVIHYDADLCDDRGTRKNVPHITHVSRDVDGNLWFASEAGLLQFLPETGRFKMYLHGEVIFSILTPRLSNTNTIFLGLRNRGLIAMDRISGKTIRFSADRNNPNSLSEGWIYYLHEGSDSLLWIGTGTGLDCARIAEGIDENLVFHHYTTADGLPDQCVVSIQEDRSGRLWVGTQNGLARLDRSTGRFRVYDQGDGIANSTFVFKASAMDHSGHLYFGTMRELLVFHPDSLRDNPYVPPIQLTDFQLFHKPVPIDPHTFRDRRNGFCLPRSISYLDTLILSYRENVFSLVFAALDYRNPLKNQYAYMLEGFDEDWIHTDAARRRITYTNLDPGEYLFRVRGSNNDGLWNEEGRMLAIIITPPWWQTAWAYTGYILLGLSILSGIWLFQLSRIQLRHQAELEHMEAERYQELDQMKSRFFANISHEFRTPLTLILGPIEKMLAHFKDGEWGADLRLMKKHARGILDLVTQLLDLSKLESRKMKLRASRLNVVDLVKGLVQSFASMADRQKITLTFDAESEDVQAYVDKEAVVKIMNNLLSNAFKFTASGGRVQVDISTNRESELSAEGEVVITISDTGIGIPADRLGQIFNRFYQVDSSETREGEGTGIGLALTRELVELHKGRIDVGSREGEGTTFTVRLPLGRAHLSEQEIDTEPEAVEEVTAKAIVIEEEETMPAPPAGKKSLPIVLIVEDNTDVRRYIRGYLDEGYRCHEAANGEEGLDQAVQVIPDLILSDIMMPKMDGVEFCRRIKTDERTSHIPVILLTAKADLGSRLEGLETGADDYLAKPFEAAELQVRIRNLIEQRRQLRARFLRDAMLEPTEIAVTSTDERFIRRAVQIIETNLDNPDFSVQAFSKQMSMSHSQLYRKIEALTNQSISAFIRTMRLKRAAQLLQQKYGNVTDIAYEVGFNNLSYFARCFREHFGKSPSEYVNDPS